eukprot:553141-Rhodomonas_salina.2
MCSAALTQKDSMYQRRLAYQERMLRVMIKCVNSVLPKNTKPARTWTGPARLQPENTPSGIQIHPPPTLFTAAFALTLHLRDCQKDKKSRPSGAAGVQKAVVL